MVLKRSLSAALALSMALPATLPSLANAQAAPPAATGSDTIDMIVKAMSAKSPAEARKLLQAAKANAATEQLPAKTLENVNALIQQASLKISLGSNPFSGGAPVSFSVDGSAPSKAPKTTPQPAAPATLEQMIERNPDLQSTMREITLGRLQRDSSPDRLDQMVHDTTNQTVADSDKAHAVTEAVLADAGEFIKALRATGVLHDWSATNKALRAAHESVPVDVLAEQIIAKSTEKAVLAAVIKKLVHSQGLSTKREFAGVSIEALGVYAINADLILRLADLYDMNLSESQQDIAVLTILPLGKLFLFAAKQRATVKQTVERVSELYGEAKANPNPTAMDKFYVSIFASPIMAGIAKRMGLGNRITAARTAVENARNKPATAAEPVAPKPEVPVAAPVAAPAAAEAGALEGAVAKVEGAAAVAEQTVADAGGVVEKAAKAPLSWKAQATWLIANMFFSGVETYATGRVSMWWFKHEKQKERDMETSDFHAFLMETDKSIAFFKLLIAIANSDSSLPAIVNLNKSAGDRRVDYIMNVARSIRICSPAEAARFKQLKAQGANLAGKAKNLVNGDYRLLRFECDHSLGFTRYNQIAKEFLTYNAIPEDQIGLLRTASYEQRMQMGELLMQLQFLYQEPSDAQNQFFRTTITKILGLDRVEDANYFSRLYGFIRERGGLTQSVSSPTGWVISPDAGDDPYALSANYTVPGGPDLPPPPPVAGK